MNAGLEVREKGPGRAYVLGATRSLAQARALEDWLAERIDVVGYERHRGSGALYITYDDGDALPGRFLRGLKDKIHTLTRHRGDPRPFDVTPVHSLPGRVRLRATGIEDGQLATLTMLTAGLPGVTHTKHVPGSPTMLVVYDPAALTEALIIDALRKTDRVEWDREWHKPTPIRWIGAASGTSVLFMCITGAASYPWLAFGVAMNTLPPLLRSVSALREGTISVDVLDVAATLAALATGRPITAAFVIWMVGVGDLLLDVSANNARSALSTLMRRRERQAFRVLARGRVETVSVGDLRVGDEFVVHTGHAIVADGTVVSGLAEVDEKALTGESRLLSKKKGDAVFSSTIVVEGQIVVRVTQSGNATEAAKIESILNTVGSKPLTLQRDALDFAGKLVLPTFGVAGIAAGLAADVTRAVCVLITDFGTGIRIAVPTSALTAMSLAARDGVLVKGAQYLERLAKTDVVVFDKTGTLTSGVPEVLEVIAVRGVKKSMLIQLCASAEGKQDHPVARALKSYASARGIRLVEPEPGSEECAVGLGVSARVQGKRVRVGRARWMQSQKLKIGLPLRRHLARFARTRSSSLCVAVDDRVVGLVSYSDGTRPESAATIQSLRGGGRRRVVLLSGDSPAVVKTVARALGIDDAVGGLLPEEKAELVRRFRATGSVVAMVGDGINDAPALASADVGISLVGSTDVAIETADVVLLEGGLARLEAAFRLGDQAMSSVRQSLGMIIVPNAVAIALGAVGFITPPIAAVINNGATVLAVLVGVLPLLRPADRALGRADEAEPASALLRLPVASDSAGDPPDAGAKLRAAG